MRRAWRSMLFVELVLAMYAWGPRSAPVSTHVILEGSCIAAMASSVNAASLASSVASPRSGCQPAPVSTEPRLRPLRSHLWMVGTWKQ